MVPIQLIHPFVITIYRIYRIDGNPIYTNGSQKTHQRILKCGPGCGMMTRNSVLKETALVKMKRFASASSASITSSAALRATLCVLSLLDDNYKHSSKTYSSWALMTGITNEKKRISRICTSALTHRQRWIQSPVLEH
ncbi:unnamed protein product [Brugia pahangi]|uniref:Secreted protein n=1 Tax=Brugia pahangi TaxID=6280 RepID=A0A0N4TMI4_BRUPA|nr:unnamed protein product [Brugia pahangi]